jgi:hypothetical protein
MTKFRSAAAAVALLAGIALCGGALIELTNHAALQGGTISIELEEDVPEEEDSRLSLGV